MALVDEQLPPRHLLISGGSPAKGAQHQAGFEQVCRDIVRHIKRVTADRDDPFDIDIMYERPALMALRSWSAWWTRGDLRKLLAQR